MDDDRRHGSAEGGIVTFRLPGALKAALCDIARRERRPVGAVLRDMVAERVARREREAFAVEARRQSLACAAADPDSDDAAVQRELDANFDEAARAWT